MLKRIFLFALAFMMLGTSLSLGGCHSDSTNTADSTDQPTKNPDGSTAPGTDDTDTGTQQTEVPGTLTPIPDDVTEPIVSDSETIPETEPSEDSTETPVTEKSKETEKNRETTAVETTAQKKSYAPEGFVNALDYGVRTNTKNCSNQLRSCINNYGKVYLPKGDYYITAGIFLGNNVEIRGEEGTVFHVCKDIDLFTVKGSYISTTVPATRAENITVRNLSVVSDTPINKYVLEVLSAKNITVDNIKVSGMGLIHTTVNYPINCFDGTEDPSLTAGVFSDECLTENVTVSNCKVDCCNATESGATGIYLCFLNHFTVSNCHVRNAWQGIQFWGGDSEYSRGGLPKNRKNAKNGLITNSSSFDVGGGGIWGSMGENITVTHCETGRCGDVGFDFEGCNNVKATYGKVSDCKNGNFATFMYCCGTVEFSHNESYLSKDFHQHYFNSNPSRAIVEQSITFDHNVFYAEELSRLFVASEIRDFIFTNNTCTNTVINTLGNNNLSAVSNVQIRDNTFHLTVPTTDKDSKQQVILAAARSDVGGVPKNLIITGNKITRAEGVATQMGIRILQNRDGQACNAVCNNNTITGYALGIMLHNDRTGGGAGSLHVELKNNTTNAMLAQGVNITYDIADNKNASGKEVGMEVK